MKTRIWMCLATLFLMIAGSLTVGPAAAGPKGSVVNTDSEPNGDFANATEVIPDAGNTITIHGIATQSDQEDFYKIQLNRSGANSEKLNVTTEVPDSSAACRLFIYDPNAKFMVLDADASNLFNHSVETVAAVTGYYFVWYECFLMSGYTTVDYNMTFTKTGVSGVSIENGTPATSTPIPSTPATVAGTIDDPADQADFFNITLISDMFAADVVTFQAIPSGTLAIYMEVYMPNLTYLNTDFHYSPTDPSHPLGDVKSASFSAVVAGNYYIRVLAVFGTGTYSVNVSKTTVARDTFNSAETAGGLPDFTDGHYVDFSDTLGKDVDNEDYFSFPASLGQIINATLWSPDYNQTLDRPQITMELRSGINETYGAENSTGVAKKFAYAEGESPDSTQASLIHISLLTYYGGAGNYLVNLTVDNKPVIFDGTWEYDFSVNESSNATLNLTKVFYDPDGDPLDYDLVNNGEGKTMVSVPKGTDLATFTAVQGGWTGTENYTVTATDPFGYSAMANILVNVGAVNHPPYVRKWDIPDITAHPTDILLSTLNLSSYFDDDDKANLAINDYLTYHFKDASPLAITPQLIPGTLKHSGGITIVVPDMPELTMPMVVTVTFWATDIAGLSTPGLTCNITIKPLNNTQPRWSTTFTEMTMNESQPGKLSEASMDLAKVCADPDAWDRDNLTFTARNYNISAFSVNFTRSLVKITPRIGFYTMPPHENMTFNASDTRGASAETTITLIVRHLYVQPKFVDPYPAGTSLEMDENATQAFWANVTADPQLSNLTPQPFKYRWFVNGTIQPSALPNFVLTTDFTTAVRSPFNVTITFNDSVGEISRTWKMTVRNINQLPVNVKITSPSKLNFTSGTIIEFSAALATDPDDPGAVLTYEWKDNEASLGTGQIYRTSKISVGVHKIQLIVTDPDGASVTAEYTIRVKAKPNPPFLPGMEGMVLLAAIGAAVGVAAVLMRKR
jgi:hypothetical protein